MLAALFCLRATAAQCEVTGDVCYHDLHPNTSRVLSYPSARPKAIPELTREVCMGICFDAHFTLAGVENGHQCFCGNRTSVDATKAKSAECDKLCAGNSSEKCGGGSRINVLNFSCSGLPPVPHPTPKPTPTPPKPSVVPHWNATYNMSLSTVIMPCNFSGFSNYDRFPALRRFGLIDYDWSHAKQHWVNQGPMTCQADIIQEAARTKSINPQTKVFVYR